MSQQLFSAIQNRDGATLARMMGPDSRQHEQPQDNVVNISAERLVDALFSQLKQVFPAAEQTSLRTEAQETAAKRQWIAAFAENGIRTREQLAGGMRKARASQSPFWPSPGQFVSWCKDSATVLGFGIDEVMAEFQRYNREKGLHTGGAERFPWKHPVLYWIVCDTRRAMYQRCLSEAEVEKHAAKKLDEWARKVAAGESIPDPIKSLEVKREPMQAAPLPTGNDTEFRYMPDAAMLGSVTPAQWLMAEYQRRKAAGMVK
ncbi:replication protein P [Cronobacter sakazakii]|nr:replication protein [Cronobacter sakazakii]